MCLSKSSGDLNPSYFLFQFIPEVCKKNFTQSKAIKTLTSPLSWTNCTRKCLWFISLSNNLSRREKKLVSIRHQHFELFMVEREFVPTKSTSLNGFKGHVVVTMLHLSPTKTPLVVLHLDRDFCVQVNKIGFQEKWTIHVHCLSALAVTMEKPNTFEDTNQSCYSCKDCKEDVFEYCRKRPCCYASQNSLGW